MDMSSSKICNESNCRKMCSFETNYCSYLTALDNDQLNQRNNETYNL